MTRLLAATLSWTGVGSAPASTALPSISGLTLVGQVLTASSGVWTGAPYAFTYQWAADGAEILGANAPMLTIGADLRFKFLSVAVVAIGVGGATTATSIPVGPVTSVSGGAGLDFSDPDNSQYLGAL